MIQKPCCFVSLTVLASITVHPEHVHSQQNSSVTLPCKAVGGSNITYKWKRNGTVIQRLGKNGDLTIDSVQQTDEGTYQCEATNDRGEVAVSKQAMLVVYGKSGLVLTVLSTIILNELFYRSFLIGHK